MKIHIVPNSHIDPVWLWNKYEGTDEVLNTFRSACDRLDEYSDLTFSASSTQFYEWVKKYDLLLFNRIKKFVKAGRWEISGGWWVEPDTNIPSEKSFIKHAEISKNFLLENFNRTTEVAFLPDSFGHPATLPKILSETGFKYFVFCRPSAVEKPDIKSNLFYWEFEGHKVLAYRLKNHYTQRGQVDILKDDEYKVNNVNCFFFGIGNHGGGPSILEIEYYKKYIEFNPGIDIGFSTCERFFKDAEKNIKDIPVYKGDLHMHAVGCYSVLRNLKQKIRQSESVLGKAEKLLKNKPDAKNKIEHNWKKLLFNEFHDILPGSCSKNAETDALNQLGGIISECEDMIYDCYKEKSLNEKVNYKTGELRVYNSLDYDIKKPVQIEFSNLSHSRTKIYNSKGKEVTKQEILPEARTLFTKRWEFVDTIPANGCSIYNFNILEKTVDDDKQLDYFLNGSADINKYIPKINFLLVEDFSDTWGHGIQKYDIVKNILKKNSTLSSDGPVSSKILEKYSSAKSDVSVCLSKYKELKGIYLDLHVNWNDTNSILKMELEIDNPIDYCLMECAGGAVKRKGNGVELPLHNWVYCPQKEKGIVIIQNGAFACDYNKGKLRINLIRSSIYGWHEPYKTNEKNNQFYTDLGYHDFSFLIIPEFDFNEKIIEKEKNIFLEKFTFINESYKKND